SDTAICYGDEIQLKAKGGVYYHWKPDSSITGNLSNPLIFINPNKSTTYTLTVRDTLGCPKPVDTTINVRVVPPVKAFAGHDTIITIGQKFQLQAHGGDKYKWSPAK